MIAGTCPSPGDQYPPLDRTLTPLADGRAHALVRPSGGTPDGPVLVNDARQGPQGGVGFSRTRKHCRHVGLQYHQNAARGVPRRILVGPGATEVVLPKYPVGIDPTGIPAFTLLSS